MGESRMISLFKEREYIMFYCLNCQLHKVSKSFFLYANLVPMGKLLHCLFFIHDKILFRKIHHQFAITISS